MGWPLGDPAYEGRSPSSHPSFQRLVSAYRPRAPRSGRSGFGQLWSFDSARPGVREGFLGLTTNDRVSMYSGYSGKGLVWGGTTS